jgi:hypothetical protein
MLYLLINQYDFPFGFVPKALDFEDFCFDELIRVV